MKKNVPRKSVFTFEGAKAQKVSASEELRRIVTTCMLWEPTFYESGDSIAKRIENLAAKVDRGEVSALAIHARTNLHLRHVPLYLLVCLARRQALRHETLTSVIQRPDEITEFLAMYWQEGKCPIAKQVKLGLANSFKKFNEYQLAKWNSQDREIKLRDAMYMVRPKPVDDAQAALFKRLAKGELEVPTTWEIELLRGGDKKEVFTRLLSENKLGSMALVMNLRNMNDAGVDHALIRTALGKDLKRMLPFQFLTASRFVPVFEDALDAAMLRSLVNVEKLPGTTLILVDVSGSMDAKLSEKGLTTRMDAASGVAVLGREMCDSVIVASFSDRCVVIPARRGMALRDAIVKSQAHSATYTGRALAHLKAAYPSADRIIVITDEQSHDAIPTAHWPNSYMINVAPYANGVGYGNGWTHINGWSEAVVDYIREIEKVGTVNE